MRCACIGKVTCPGRILKACNKSGPHESQDLHMNNEHIVKLTKVYLRLALAITFLVAIADRFGWLGAYGSRNVSWGDWGHFVQYVSILNWFVPKSLIPALAIVETILELALGIALLLGIYQRIVAWSSSALLLSFAVTMSFALGIIAPLSYSVYTALGGAFLLGAIAGEKPARSPAAVN